MHDSADLKAIRQTASAAGVPSPGPRSPSRAVYLASMLLVALIPVVVTGCGVIADIYKAASCILNPGSWCGDDPGENKPAEDCISYRDGQSVGTKPCGPAWDSDNDTISTATETNPTNRIGNSPIAGFYTFDTLKWDLNLSIARGGFTSGSLDNGMNLRDTGPGYDHSGYRGCDGVDIDVRYLRKNGAEGPLDICDPNQAGAYDTTATLNLFAAIVVENGDSTDGKAWVDMILADTTCLGFVNAPNDPYIVHDTSHRDHFHVRIRDPDGPNN